MTVTGGSGALPRSVIERFEAQAALTPTATAATHGNRSLSYAELDERSSRLAWLLARRGAARERLVALVIERSFDLIVAMLAVLKSGAGYVPVEPDDPAGRISYILGESKAVLVVTSELTAPVVRSLVSPSELLCLGTPQVTRALAACPADLGRSAAGALRRSPADLAYVIYTSGSTGAPKGVAVEHRALAAYLRHACDNYPSAAGLALLHSPVSFDLAVTTIYAPLLSGGQIAVGDLAGWSGRRSPAFLKVTPSHLALLAALPAEVSPTEMLVVGGESLTSVALESWRAGHPQVRVVNEYGPTEATVGCCTQCIGPDDRLDSVTVPIGTPTAGTRLYVLDDKLDQVPGGSPGELYIAGEQLARGYLGRPGLTAASFVPDPYGPAGSRMYASGDLARRLANGGFEYLGRRDRQVKINGYRIEPAEIEAALTSFDAVAQAAVIPREDDAGTRSLVGYVVAEPGKSIARAGLLDHAARRLPAHLIPAHIVVRPELPLTASGKLDVAALAADGIPARPGADRVAPRTDLESLLCGLIAELTGVSQVGIDDDFIAMGGTSIVAAKLVTRARRAGLALRLAEVLRKRTVRGMLADYTEPASQQAGRSEAVE